MFCSKCGTELPNGSSFCSNCGAQQSSMNYQNNDQQNHVQDIEQNIYSTPASYTDSTPDQKEGMGWYKFLIYFALFAGAVINFVQGILYLSGEIYEVQAGVSADYIYNFVPSLKILDVIYGIILFAMAAFAIYVRMRLKNFYKNGPTCLIAMNITVLAVGILYLVIGGAIVNSNLLDANALGSMIGSITVLLINIFYFKKRKYMFVN